MNLYNSLVVVDIVLNIKFPYILSCFALNITVITGLKEKFLWYTELLHYLRIISFG